MNEFSFYVAASFVLGFVAQILFLFTRIKTDSETNENKPVDENKKDISAVESPKQIELKVVIDRILNKFNYDKLLYDYEIFVHGLEYSENEAKMLMSKNNPWMTLSSVSYYIESLIRLENESLYIYEHDIVNALRSGTTKIKCSPPSPPVFMENKQKHFSIGEKVEISDINEILNSFVNLKWISDEQMNSCDVVQK